MSQSAVDAVRNFAQGGDVTQADDDSRLARAIVSLVAQKLGFEANDLLKAIGHDDPVAGLNASYGRGDAKAAIRVYDVLTEGRTAPVEAPLPLRENARVRSTNGKAMGREDEDIRGEGIVLFQDRSDNTWRVKWGGSGELIWHYEAELEVIPSVSHPLVDEYRATPHSIHGDTRSTFVLALLEERPVREGLLSGDYNGLWRAVHEVATGSYLTSDEVTAAIRDYDLILGIETSEVKTARAEVEAARELLRTAESRLAALTSN